MSAAFTFTLDRYDELGKQYVEEGSAVLRAERQADVDGGRRFLLSEHFSKFRREDGPAPGQILRTEEGFTHQPRSLDAVGVAGCKATTEAIQPKPLTPLDEEDMRDG